ncbi:MAG: imidazolonepropionase-like amidohydrolase [Planctomycetota bacterium]|jgi:imidazolonepropionase-like amidohydrolase
MIRTSKTLLFLALPLFLGAAIFTPAAFSSPVFTLEDDEDEAGEDAEDAEDAEEEEEEADRYLAVVGGDIYSGTGAVLRGATILSKNGVIEEIGFDLFIPEEAEILEAHGMRVYPGMVAIEASSSIVVSSNRMVNQVVGDLHPVDHEIDPVEVLTHLAEDLAEEFTETRSAVEDNYDPFGQNLLLALSTGITSTVASGSAIKLKRGEIDGLVMNENQLVDFTWSAKNPAGKRSLKEKFDAASEYLRNYRQWENRSKADKEEKAPSEKGVDKSVLGVLTGKMRAKFTCNDQPDLLSLARLAQKYEFRPVIVGCLEGWTVADELGRAGATAIITPRSLRDADETLVRASGSTIENAAILHAHGVQIAIIPADTTMNMQGIMGRDLMHLPIEVGFAMRGGLSESAALESVTVVPARLLGISHRVGTLEEGKDCDLIVTDGDLLHYQTFVQYTVVDGSIAYDKQEEIFFAHIRPRANADEVLDPGEEGAVDPLPKDEATETESEEESEDTDEGAGDEGDEDADEEVAEDDSSSDDD